jgi:hypothetical protein
MSIEGLPGHLAQQMVKFLGQRTWEYPIVLDVLEWLLSARIAVLGGDVLRDGLGGPCHTGDNWYLNPQPGMLWGTYVDQSIHRAREYICAYPKSSAGRYLFALVCAEAFPSRP